MADYESLDTESNSRGSDIDADLVQIAGSVVQQAYSGPVPLPGHVEALNRIEDGLGTELVRDYLRQREHDRQQEIVREANYLILAQSEANHLDELMRYKRNALIIGAAIFLTLICCAVWCLRLGNTAAAALFLAAPVVAVVGAFISDYKPLRRVKKP